jgi:hypothetical protein
MQLKIAALLAAGLTGVTLCSVVNAAVVEYSFNTGSIMPPSVPMAGTGPWLDIKFQDTATAGTVAVSVSANLVGAQTLTGIWLNLDPVLTGSLVTGSSSFGATGASGTGVAPGTFVAVDADPGNTGSGIHKLQDLGPSAATKAQVGRYNVQLRFPNSTGAFMGTETETFNLVSPGLTANSFLFRASQTAGGLPNPAPYALASFTNADGTTGGPGSGIAYISATPVPEPEMYALMLTGLGLAGLLVRRRMPAQSS